MVCKAPQKIKNFIGGLAAAAVFALLFFSLNYAHAATLDISSRGSVAVGETFTATVSVSSPEQAMNAASGDVDFSTSKLQVVSVSQSNSIVDLWVRSPSYSNSVAGGDVNFEGVVLNPGFTGINGEILEIVFRAIAAGSADIGFSNGTVLAHDGNGTNILTAMNGTMVDVVPANTGVGPYSTAPSGNGTASGAALSSPGGDVAANSSAASAGESASSTGAAPAASSSAGISSSTGYSAVAGTPYDSTSYTEPVLPAIILWWLLVVFIGLVALSLVVAFFFFVVREFHKLHVASREGAVQSRKKMLEDLKRFEEELERDAKQ